MLQQQEEEEELVVMCLQAQRVAGLPAALDGRPIQVECFLLNGEALACAHASSAAGVAVFHDQVLLLHCGPLASSSCFTLSISAHHPTQLLSTLSLDLSHLYRRPSPIALRFALSHGALLKLALHHRRVALHSRSSSCCCLPLALPPSSCFHYFQHRHQPALDDDDDDAGFITIDKQKQAFISRLPPSDDLFSTDDDDDKPSPSPSPSSSRHLLSMDHHHTMEADSNVEDEFLAMLDANSDLNLDRLINDAEAQL